jgi:hypothetical protein
LNWYLPELASDFPRLPTFTRDCQRFPEIAGDHGGLLEIVTGCWNLSIGDGAGL